MNINSLLNPSKIKTKQGLMITRLERIKREGSRYYSWIPGAILTTAQISIHVEDQFPRSAKYKPLDWLEIVNNEPVNNLRLIINGSYTLPVPAGTIRPVERHPLWHLTIINDGAGATTEGLIVVTVQKAPLTVDRWVARQ